MTRALLVFLVTLAGASAWAALRPGVTIQPGALLPGHAALRNDCTACHVFGRGVESERCRSCHATDSIGRSRPALTELHARTAALECSACHAEHAGRLGRARAARFQHELVPAELSADCALCHAGRAPKDELHPGAGEDCAQCHTTTAWFPARFEHARWFRFDEHHPARCGDCHEPGRGFKTYTCATCHSPAQIAHEHDELGARDLGNCVECHRTGNKHDAEHGGEGREGGRRGKREHEEHEDDEH